MLYTARFTRVKEKLYYGVSCTISCTSYCFFRATGIEILVYFSSLVRTNYFSPQHPFSPSPFSSLITPPNPLTRESKLINTSQRPRYFFCSTPLVSSLSPSGLSSSPLIHTNNVYQFLGIYTKPLRENFRKRRMKTNLILL